MSQVLEIEGRTIDEAIFAGLEQMGVSFDEVDIDILESGTKGFLGIGTKQARVRLTRRDEEDQPIKPQAPQPQASFKSRPVEKHDRPAAPPQRTTAPERSFRSSTPAPSKAPVGQPVDASNPAVNFLENVLSYMQVDATVKGVQTADALHLQISGDKTGQLIGYRGETLDSLQYLVSLVLNKNKPEYTRVLLDTGDYRAKREQTLIRLAQHLASKAIKSEHRVSLEPMNPYERRIIHSALQNNHRVTTCSEGEEPNRRIIISPKK